MEEDKVIKGQPKSFLKKLKENVDDHDEQMACLLYTSDAADD